MTIFEYIKHFPDLKRNVKEAFMAGIKFGIWAAGIIIILILAILHTLFNFHI
jgi:hypothetical protein